MFLTFVKTLATMRKMRPGQTDTRTMARRRQSATSQRGKNSSVSRRGSQFATVDTQVSILPDLSENVTDEERIWEEILEIKSMPVSMSEKREMKQQLQVSIFVISN